jgi:threonine synthase
MNYKSTNNQSAIVDFKEAVIKGLANDKGLFFPLEIPKLPDYFFKELEGMEMSEIAFYFLKNYVGNVLSDKEIKQIVEEALNFDIPLLEIEPNIYALELYHGPTLAFKDVGARVMARFLAKFSGKDKKITVLVATSGDTGSAVANGFFNVKGVEVVVLYPKGMVSNIQEKQFTTLGKNIIALEIDGTFDDCQRLVKEAFLDNELNSKLNLSSANSINVARFLPQAVYYFYAFAKLKDKTKPIVFSVPSGNYGNLTAGLFAKASGLPISQFIAASNVNNIVPNYIETGIFEPKSSISTISNAMDVGNPSNFARILEIFNHSWAEIRKNIVGFTFSDDETRKNMLQVYKNTGYILDPHGAVAYSGLKEYLKNNQAIGIFLETAHPAKFFETVEDTISQKINIPNPLQMSLSKEKLSIFMENSFDEFKNFLLQL